MIQEADVVCVGGGGIGLMTAYELAKAGLRVAVVDRGRIGGESSWAGAGILSPAHSSAAVTAYDRLRGYSFDRFPGLASELLERSGVDVGFQNTGAVDFELTLDRPGEDPVSLFAMASRFRVRAVPLNARELRIREPGIADPIPAPTSAPHASLNDAAVAAWLPDYCQVRNPRLLRAIHAACDHLGVGFVEHFPVEACVFQSGSWRVADGAGRSVRGSHVVVAAGAWAAGFLEKFGIALPVKPVRGQILALQSAESIVRHIILDGKRYLVPRGDGLVLVGSTEEDAGFDKRTTNEAIADLRRFAVRLFPRLAAAGEAARWAGLRPGCALGTPVIGPAPGFDNLWIAAGHFREGIQLSPGTARLLADWIVGRDSFAQPGDFGLDADRTSYAKPFES